jgi:Co/Zn/Cd efflux system component
MLFSDGVHLFTDRLSLIIMLLSTIIAKKTKNKPVELVVVAIKGLTLFYFGP